MALHNKCGKITHLGNVKVIGHYLLFYFPESFKYESSWTTMSEMFAAQGDTVPASSGERPDGAAKEPKEKTKKIDRYVIFTEILQ